jgi:hypothetical protein
MKRCCLLLLLVFAVVKTGISQQENSYRVSEYYPLARGNRWIYRVQIEGRPVASRVEWRVTSEKRSQEADTYQVWPTPMQSDDEAMELRVSAVGIEEMASRVLILRSQLAKGDTWISGGAPWSSARKSRVLSVHEPCRVGSISSRDCVRLEDDEEKLHLRIVTTYARGIGPVRYEYFRGSPPGEVPVQIVELTSYHLSPK